MADCNLCNSTGYMISHIDCPCLMEEICSLCNNTRHLAVQTMMLCHVCQGGSVIEEDENNGEKKGERGEVESHTS